MCCYCWRCRKATARLCVMKRILLAPSFADRFGFPRKTMVPFLTSVGPPFRQSCAIILFLLFCESDHVEWLRIFLCYLWYSIRLLTSEDLCLKKAHERGNTDINIWKAGQEMNKPQLSLHRVKFAVLVVEYWSGCWSLRELVNDPWIGAGNEYEYE